MLGLGGFQQENWWFVAKPRKNNNQKWYWYEMVNPCEVFVLFYKMECDWNAPSSTIFARNQVLEVLIFPILQSQWFQGSPLGEHWGHCSLSVSLKTKSHNCLVSSKQIAGTPTGFLVGGWALPLWKIWVRQLGLWHSQYIHMYIYMEKIKAMFQAPTSFASQSPVACGVQDNVPSSTSKFKSCVVDEARTADPLGMQSPWFKRSMYFRDTHPGLA
jgi:hypothetical protein